MRILVYDCEIKYGIPPRGEDPIDGIVYCEGWKDFAGMGVSVTGVYDYFADAYRVFCDDNVEEMFYLFANADMLVSFNGIGFDDPLLLATYPEYSTVLTKRYDLLVEIWRASGLAPKWGGSVTHGGYGLDAMGEANFNERKTGHGADAPVNWQRGKIGSVIDYCLNDVRMTKMLLDAVRVNHPLVNPRGGTLKLRRPDEMVERSECFPPKDTTYENRAEMSQEMDWEDIAVTFAQDHGRDGYEVEVQDNDGILVKTFLHLHEWTGYATPFINEQDAQGLINYLVSLNTTSEGMRDGTIIR
jgi:hypothetical protein